MTDDLSDDTPEDATETVEQAVERFIADADTTLAEYDQGYADADATVRRLRAHLADLRERVEE